MSALATHSQTQCWQKLGQIYTASGEADWMQSHAYIPTSILLPGDRIRVYVAFLDAHKVGRLGFVDVDARDPLKILGVPKTPVLDIGEPGTFDANGVTPICILPYEDRLYLYYTGWQTGTGVRYTLFSGLAVSTDGGETFQRTQRVPILDRSDRELFVRTAPFVLREGPTWRMWYLGGDHWIDVGGKSVPTYNLRHLTSPDGRTWGSTGQVCMEPDTTRGEYGFGRPYVLKEAQGYRMWYSVRQGEAGYHLGYAESADGLTWDRQDAAVGLTCSASGWDSHMQCFSWLQATPYGTYMFYNGNNYGETGFGVAVLTP